MNKEERKAIEDMNRFAIGIDMSCVTARQMQIILNLIEKLQKENEELKERIREHTLLISPYYVKENFIPVQKVKDKIKSNKEIINKTNDGDLIHALNQENKVLQKLLGENNGNR